MTEGDPLPFGGTLIEGVAWGNEFDAARESWRKRHRENNIDRMAKAMYGRSQGLVFVVTRQEWSKVGAEWRALAEAAYDAL